MNTTETITRRLDRLEAELRRSQRRAGRYRDLCIALAAAGVVAALLAAARQDVADLLRIKRLEVVDNEGRLVLAASAGANGGQLDLWSPAGTNVLRASANEHGGDLAIWNNGGTNDFAVLATRPPSAALDAPTENQRAK